MKVEECIKKYKTKPVLKIKRIKIFRYKLVCVKKNNNMFRSNEPHLDWKYWHSFSIGYNHMEIDTFSKNIGWYYRERKILIPKIINNILKFLFGKRYYSISRTYEDKYVYHSEMVDSNTKNQYIKEFEDDGCSQIYIVNREIKYNGWLWITKSESSNEISMINFMRHLYLSSF